ncbi:MAG: DUF255 domain-containing protein [Phycisphaerae bacterium]|nr:DUF255 domain-containing protein [Phycisphaerae bacterium]NUQ44918.1 DUF255 domain-containing protein [Phycisphaerae bacterium]
MTSRIPLAAIGSAPLAVVAVLVLSHTLTAEPPAADGPAKPKAARTDIYDTKADARALIAAATKKAARDNQRVLIMYGGNWCGWCHKLHDLFRTDKDIARTLLYEYQLVMVDVGRFDKNTDVAKDYGADLKAGVPFLTVLDGAGKVLANQETGALEKGDQHDPAKVLAFLKKHQAEPQDAREVHKAAMARAKSEGKLLFLHVGAPWCVWCHRLEDYLADEKIAPVIAKAFVDVKIDQDRMKNAEEVIGAIRKDKQGGIPWFAFIDAGGKPLITSEGPDGNVGCPVAPAEIAHFEKMLGYAGGKLSESDVKLLIEELKRRGEALQRR